QSDLDELESRCNQSASECRFLSRPIMLPPVFQCNEGNLCATCEMVADAYNDFKNHYPQYTPAVDESGDEQQGKINQLFSHYMNQQLGLSRQTIEYLAFMDSCGLSEADLNCKNLNQLQKQYNRDVNPYRFESFLQSNHLNLDQNVIRDWNTIISDGMLRWPQEIRDTTTRDWVYFQHTTRNSAGNKFCIQNGYSIEWSFRSLKNVLKENDDVFYFQDNNVHFTVSKRGIVNPGIYLREIKESAAEFPSPVVLFSGSILLNSDPEIIYKKWSTIKLSVTPADIAIYFDGQLVKTVAKTSTSDTLSPEGLFTLAFFDYQGALDWIKMYDADGNVTVHEDYNDPSTRAVIHPSFLCPQPGGDCKDLFTNFFNQKQGTSYSYEEIESLYLTTCGERLDVCGSLQYKKENLIDAVDGYYLNSVPGLVKHKIQSEATVLSNNPVELFRDGLLQLPESLQGPGQWYYGYQIDFKRLCTQNGFAIEHRFKLGNPELSGNLFYTGHRAVEATFSYYPEGLEENLPGLYVEKIALYTYDNAPKFDVPGSWLIKEGDDFRNMWLAVKTVVRPNKVEIHLNNQKIWEYDRDPAIPINQYQNFGLYPRGTKSKYDYIKIWDSNDNLVYYEDFNNGHRPAVIKSDFICVTQQ
ncbi:MAG: hypothetical protein H3C48_19115, partial [Chitinophagaceae bacterium]|nr:hypothetical protein [Chitinophagaceae bacterium]